MKFFKLHTYGNDFILFDLRKDKEWKDRRINIINSDFLLKICIRRFGIGADGVLLLEGRDGLPLSVTIFNKDGSPAEISGNGLFCVAEYLSRAGEFDSNSIEIMTGGGKKTIERNGEFFVLYMGRAEYPSGEEPVEIKKKDSILRGYHVNMGNPHFVLTLSDGDIISLFPEDIIEVARDRKLPSLLHSDRIDISGLIEAIRETSLFPRGVNVEFVAGGKKEFYVKVIERGVGETFSCGSGASAVTSALIRAGLSEMGEEIELNFKGGTYRALEDEDGVRIKGRGRFIYSGRLETKGLLD